MVVVIRFRFWFLFWFFFFFEIKQFWCEQIVLFWFFVFYSLKIILLTSSSWGVQTGSVSESANSSGSAMASSVATAVVVFPNTAMLFVLALRKHCSRLGGKFSGSKIATTFSVKSNNRTITSHIKFFDVGLGDEQYQHSTTAIWLKFCLIFKVWAFSLYWCFSLTLILN